MTEIELNTQYYADDEEASDKTASGYIVRYIRADTSTQNIHCSAQFQSFDPPISSWSLPPHRRKNDCL